MGRRAARPVITQPQRRILARLVHCERGAEYTANHHDLIALKRLGLVQFADGTISKGRRMWILTEKGARAVG